VEDWKWEMEDEKMRLDEIRRKVERIERSSAMLYDSVIA
jgi:hypothetical protein